MESIAVIFDMDGTLLDTIDDLSESANQVLREEGFPEHHREAYFKFVGNGARKLVERMLPPDKLSHETVERLHGKFRRIYRDRQFVKTAPYVGIPEMLARIRDLGIPMAILSNKPHDLVQEIAAYYFSGDLFSTIAGQRDSIPHKPAPDGAILVARELGILPENCYFIGDSSVDMDTAVNAGMKAVGVSWGFRSVEELKAHGADYIIDTPGQLLSLL